jgi:ElaB/YqjD/DUF883 family membrane-anchored ribosome-binding protein
VADELTPAANPHDLQGELEQSRESAARLLDALARKLGTVGGMRGAACRAGRAARYVHDHSVRDMVAGIDRFVRRYPVPSAALAVVAGFLAGRVIRSR